MCVDGNDEKVFSMSLRRFSIDLSMSVQLDVQKGVIPVDFFGGFLFQPLEEIGT